MNTKPFSVTRGEQYFDWNAFLKRAEKNKVTDKELSEAEGLACGWVTCACGNLCAAIPRSGAVPRDRKLADLGGNFADYVCDANWRKAKACLKQIEERSAELLEKIALKEREKEAIAFLKTRGWTF